ncbi:hypothetical protein G7Y89_g4838 [Cudoniella acicularis]|uniref:C2H2-type domain-containing protein n=1 Tax=Cudoniella acicularis TaxID=354080 RepID=A0A8H4RPZ4_9HELO|nr:hypothetical protein G7Y89_g4838 [Cudoniella acicularis]
MNPNVFHPQGDRAAPLPYDFKAMVPPFVKTPDQAANVFEENTTVSFEGCLQLPVVPQPQHARVSCTHPGCTKTFVRDYDRIRHEQTKHRAQRGTYLCTIPGCRKSSGTGYSRPDKLTEHMWKAHSNLGYAKRV